MKIHLSEINVFMVNQISYFTTQYHVSDIKNKIADFSTYRISTNQMLQIQSCLSAGINLPAHVHGCSRKENFGFYHLSQKNPEKIMTTRQYFSIWNYERSTAPNGGDSNFRLL